MENQHQILKVSQLHVFLANYFFSIWSGSVSRLSRTSSDSTLNPMAWGLWIRHASSWCDCFSKMNGLIQCNQFCSAKISKHSLIKKSFNRWWRVRSRSHNPRQAAIESKIKFNADANGDLFLIRFTSFLYSTFNKVQRRSEIFAFFCRSQMLMNAQIFSNCC